MNKECERCGGTGWEEYHRNDEFIRQRCICHQETEMDDDSDDEVVHFDEESISCKYK